MNIIIITHFTLTFIAKKTANISETCVAQVYARAYQNHFIKFYSFLNANIIYNIKIGEPHQA